MGTVLNPDHRLYLLVRCSTHQPTESYNISRPRPPPLHTYTPTHILEESSEGILPHLFTDGGTSPPSLDLDVMGWSVVRWKEGGQNLEQKLGTGGWGEQVGRFC